MKKNLILCMVGMCVLISGCGVGKADKTDVAKEAYANLNTASDATDIISDSVLSAWEWSIEEGESYINDYEIGCAELGGAIGFKQSDVIDAMTIVLEGTPYDPDESILSGAALAQPEYCIACAIQCLDSMNEELDNTMNTTKDAIKDISDSNPDASYLEDLKDYYSEVDSYKDFATNPTGNYINAQSTVSTYRSNISSYKNSLELDLE